MWFSILHCSNSVHTNHIHIFIINKKEMQKNATHFFSFLLESSNLIPKLLNKQNANKQQCDSASSSLYFHLFFTRCILIKSQTAFTLVKIWIWILDEKKKSIDVGTFNIKFCLPNFCFGFLCIISKAQTPNCIDLKWDRYFYVTVFYR